MDIKNPLLIEEEINKWIVGFKIPIKRKDLHVIFEILFNWMNQEMNEI